MEVLAKVGPKALELAPKLLTAGNINAAMALGKAGADFYNGHHPKRDSSRPTDDGASKTYNSEEKKSRRKSHHDRLRRPSDMDGLSNQVYAQRQEPPRVPLPYPDGSACMPVDNQSYSMDQTRQRSRGSRRYSYTPTPDTPIQDSRPDYFGSVNDNHKRDSRRTNNAERRRSSVDQRRMSASYDRPSYPARERRRKHSTADRGYPDLTSRTPPDTYPAYPSRVSSNGPTKTPRPFSDQPKNGAERMLNLVAAADRGYAIPPPPMGLPRRYSNTNQAPRNTRPPMLSRLSSSGGRGSLASSTSSQNTGRRDGGYGYSDMV